MKVKTDRYWYGACCLCPDCREGVGYAPVWAAIVAPGLNVIIGEPGGVRLAQFREAQP